MAFINNGQGQPSTGSKAARFGKFTLFQSTKGKVPYVGSIEFDVNEIAGMVEYLRTLQPDGYNRIKLRVTGFENTSKSGTQYIGGYVQEDTKHAKRAGQ